MDPRHTARAAAWLAIPIAACGGAEPPQAPPGAPNVVLVSIDSLRHDHLSCYGYPRPTSPTIDRLAAEGVLFRQALSTTSWTLPAHAALFTGLYDSAHGLVDNGLKLSEEHVTLAEVFRENGWRTAGFFGGPYLHPVFGLGQGFESYQSCMTSVPDSLGEDELRAESRRFKSVSHADVTGPRTIAEVERWLEEADERPFFLFVHLWDVHYDYIPPAEYVAQFDPGYEGTLTGVDVMSNPSIGPTLPARDLQHLMALYDGEIRFTDENLGRILDALRGRGLLENTIVVVTADHGEEFMDHGGKGHRRTLYDEVLRIPLVLHWDGHFGGQAGTPRVVDDQVRLIDLMPTLLTLAGIAERPAMMGRDLTPLLLGEELEPAPSLCELLVDGQPARALRSKTFKTVSLDSLRPKAGFDLLADHQEQEPLPPGEPRVAQGFEVLRRELDRARAFGSGRAAEAVTADPEVLKRLRALGYLGGEAERR